VVGERSGHTPIEFEAVYTGAVAAMKRLTSYESTDLGAVPQ